MKKIWVLASVAVLAACNSKEPAKDDSAKSGADSTGQVINSPYPVTYSSSFVMGDPRNAETALALWKDWDGGNLSASRDKFADSIELYLSDGSVMRGSSDSIIASVQKFRTSLGTVVSRVDAVMAVKSADKDESWALVWGKEIDKDKKGKVDSFFLQETWRFNKAGKADLMYQFRAAGAAPKN